MIAFKVPTIFTAIDKYSDVLKQMSGAVGKFSAANVAALERTQKKFSEISKSALDFSKKAAVGAAIIAAPLIGATTAAVGFEDRMADVAKTTQLAGIDLQGLSEDILKIAPSTRTSIEGLQKIAEIGGQMGITSRKGIVDFTQSVDKFNVALGSDFQGGVEEASRAIGGLNVLFKETRGLSIADSITKAGSAINALSAKGVQVPELTEFTKRIGQLPDAIKPSLQDVAALGAVFNKAGITAEIAARGLGDVLLTAAQNAPKFAKQMGISTTALQRMLDTNPTEFLTKFAGTLKGMDASKFGVLAKDLKLGDVGSIKVLGALGSSLDKLAEFQAISNNEFAKGTSLLDEFNKVNSTTAAKLKQSNNNLQVLAITIGTKVLPQLNKFLDKVIPIAKSISEWIERNGELTKTILWVTAGVSGVLFLLSAFAGIVGIVTGAVSAWATVMVFVNAVMAANPIGVIVIAIGLLIAAVVLIIKYWDEWGASVAMVGSIMAAFGSPVIAVLGVIVSLIMSIGRNWDNIANAFSSGNFLDGIILIGSTIMDAVYYPLQQLLSLVEKFTGLNLGSSVIKDFRADLGLNTTEDKTENDMAVNPKVEQSNIQQTFAESIQKQSLAVDINDNSNGKATVKASNGPIPINFSSTRSGNFGNK